MVIKKQGMFCNTGISGVWNTSLRDKLWLHCETKYCCLFNTFLIFARGQLIKCKGELACVGVIRVFVFCIGFVVLIWITKLYESEVLGEQLYAWDSICHLSIMSYIRVLVFVQVYYFYVPMCCGGISQASAAYRGCCLSVHDVWSVLRRGKSACHNSVGFEPLSFRDFVS